MHSGKSRKMQLPCHGSLRAKSEILNFLVTCGELKTTSFSNFKDKMKDGNHKHVVLSINVLLHIMYLSPYKYVYIYSHDIHKNVPFPGKQAITVCISQGE